MTEKFELSITLGNEAMQSDRDVAAALRAVAAQVEDGARGGTIRDLNGNTVGEYGPTNES